MAVFEYRGLVAASGKQVHGVRDADNAKVLRALLRREGVMLTSAQEDASAKRAQAKNLDLFAFARRVSVGDVAMMTRQLATLVTAGIPLVEAVAALTGFLRVELRVLSRLLLQLQFLGPVIPIVYGAGQSLVYGLERLLYPCLAPRFHISEVLGHNVLGSVGDRHVF